jgi:hydroxymethylpyrimidine kinase/phosphomethylpyrimidine kinase
MSGAGVTSAPYPTALTIAGSDSGGGAGIQADLKTFLDHRVFGLSAVTALTAQNSRGVRRIDPASPEGLAAQLQAVFEDFPIDAVKIGMLGTAEHVRVVASFLSALPSRPPIVLDPVMVASTGHRLLDREAEELLMRDLLPLVTIATPNLDEATVFAGAAGREAAISYATTAPCAVLVTGGDVVGDEIVDVLVEGGQTRTWTHQRLGTRSFHGTGCTLSSAIAARLAHDRFAGRSRPLGEAVDGAITYVQALIRQAVELGSIGSGNPSLPHGFS